MARPVPSDAILATLRAVRAQRFTTRLACPRCDGERIQRWGSFAGRQRFRCVGCKRTFSDLTGTPLAYSKLPHKWPAYCRTLVTALSVRAAARVTGIHKDTALRWRHRTLTALHRLDVVRLSDRAELAELIFAYSNKGGAPDPTEPVWRMPLIRRDRAVVLFVTDVKRETVTVLAGPLRPPTMFAVAYCLAGRLAPGTTVRCPAGSYSGYRRFCDRFDFRFIDSRPHPARPRQRTPESLAMRAYVLSLRRFLLPFRGVATCYLHLYLHWHELLHRAGDAAHHYFYVPALRTTATAA